MSFLEEVVKEYLKLRETNHCSCTIPFENMHALSTLDKFSHCVVILSPSKSYVQQCSILSALKFNMDNCEVVFPSELANHSSGTPRETELFILLPEMQKEDYSQIESCVSSLIAHRAKRHECALICPEAYANFLFAELMSRGHSIAKESPLSPSTTDEAILWIFAPLRKEEKQPDRYWIDEDNEEIDEGT